MPEQHALVAAAEPGAHAGPGESRAGGRKHRWRRVAVFSLASLLALAGVLVAAGFLAVNHLASNVKRIHVARLDAAAAPAGGSAPMNVLITGQEGAPGSNGTPSGLIMILHINAGQKAGGVVSIHPLAMVGVPGHGQTELQNALVFGGPSLLVQTVEQLTSVPLQHYARIDFPHVANVIDTIGGVDVQTSGGTIHLDGAGALAYAGNPALTEEGRVLRQQDLIRAVLAKIANNHLLTNPTTVFGVLNALTAMLTVDSNFTNSQLAELAKALGGLSGSAATFVGAPYNTTGGRVFLVPGTSQQLWTAIRQGSLGTFASKYPSAVTPAAVP
ncbi:MAG TPA: LCP family protein [Streptosporangiaceae bacterium]